MEPKLNLKQLPTLTPKSNLVDFAFGGNDNNQKIYENVMFPLIDLAMKGGMCSVFAYGQTGSGKTYTI